MEENNDPQQNQLFSNLQLNVNTFNLKSVFSLGYQNCFYFRRRLAHLLKDNISLIYLTFEKEFTEVVEAKLVTQEEAEMTRFVVENAEQQKKAATILSSVEDDFRAAEQTDHHLIDYCRVMPMF
ncbi:hypothetical protein STEG23_035937 [Scotinomys teguina]